MGGFTSGGGAGGELGGAESGGAGGGGGNAFASGWQRARGRLQEELRYELVSDVAAAISEARGAGGARAVSRLAADAPRVASCAGSRHGSSAVRHCSAAAVGGRDGRRRLARQRPPLSRDATLARHFQQQQRVPAQPSGFPPRLTGGAAATAAAAVERRAARWRRRRRERTGAPRPCGRRTCSTAVAHFRAIRKTFGISAELRRRSSAR